MSNIITFPYARPLEMLHTDLVWIYWILHFPTTFSHCYQHYMAPFTIWFPKWPPRPHKTCTFLPYPQQDAWWCLALNMNTAPRIITIATVVLFVLPLRETRVCVLDWVICFQYTWRYAWQPLTHICIYLNLHYRFVYYLFIRACIHACMYMNIDTYM